MGKSKSETAAAKPQAATEMSGAEMVVRALKDQGVRHIFGYPGGAVLPIYDAIFNQNAIRHVLVRHEQAAVHADRKSTRLNSSHIPLSRMPSSA